MRIGFMMGYDRDRMAFAKKWGFKSLELQVGPNNGFFPGDPGWEAKAEEVKSAFAEADLRVSCLAGFYVNHMAPNDEEKFKSLTRNTIDLAVKLGVPVAAGFSGRIMGEQLEASLPKFKEIWSEHAKYAEDRNIKIAFENCPMGPYHQPPGGNNMMSTPEMWERGFNEVPSPALGLEWDPSHLICQFVDPVVTLRKFATRVHHVHAKDAHVKKDLLASYGVWAPGVIEHCHVGFGDTNWGDCIKELRRVGYNNDLNIEGWHDNVYRRDLEDEGLVVGLRHMEQFLIQD